MDAPTAVTDEEAVAKNYLIKTHVTNGSQLTVHEKSKLMMVKKKINFAKARDEITDKISPGARISIPIKKVIKPLKINFFVQTNAVLKAKAN